MSDNAKIVTDWLRKRPGQYFCQQCLIISTGVGPQAQMNQIVRPLRQAPKEWRYEDAPCAECDKDRACIAFVGV